MFCLAYLLNNRILKLSRGEIFVTNFIPPANGASLGSFKYYELF